jgi:hypothetical protein
MAQRGWEQASRAAAGEAFRWQSERIADRSAEQEAAESFRDLALIGHVYDTDGGRPMGQLAGGG